MKLIDRTLALTAGVLGVMVFIAALRRFQYLQWPRLVWVGVICLLVGLCTATVAARR